VINTMRTAAHAHIHNTPLHAWSSHVTLNRGFTRMTPRFTIYLHPVQSPGLKLVCCTGWGDGRGDKSSQCVFRLEAEAQRHVTRTRLELCCKRVLPTQCTQHKLASAHQCYWVLGAENSLLSWQITKCIYDVMSKVKTLNLCMFESRRVASNNQL
jgi:hypothetical protein